MSLKNLELNTFYSAQIEPCMSIFYWYNTSFYIFIYLPNFLLTAFAKTTFKEYCSRDLFLRDCAGLLMVLKVKKKHSRYNLADIFWTVFW